MTYFPVFPTANYKRQLGLTTTLSAFPTDHFGAYKYGSSHVECTDLFLFTSRPLQLTQRGGIVIHLQSQALSITTYNDSCESMRYCYA